MRRALAALAVLLLVSLPTPVLGQSPAPAASPPSVQLGPGVVGEVLAFMGQDPVVIRIRFAPGSSFDLSAGSGVTVITIGSGALDATSPGDLTVYDASGATRIAAAGTANTLAQGDYLLVPPGVPGHVENHGTTEATMLIASLPLAGPTADASAKG